MKILLTSGATREPIDAVRFLSNVSTGATGAHLADALTRLGHQVTLLHGHGAVQPALARDTVAFGSTEDLGRQLASLLGSGTFDAVIHAAAVSDYRPATVADEKLSSYLPELTLRLVPTPKLLARLKSFSPAPLLVVGFKLTSAATPAERDTAIARLFASRQVDFVVHNDLTQLAAGDTRPFRACLPDGAHTDLPGLAALTGWLHQTFSSAHKFQTSPA